jgi:large subunit ribosomal protein L28
MAQQCDICGKKPQAGNRISHAHNVTKRRWNINLRPVHARVGAATKRMRLLPAQRQSRQSIRTSTTEFHRDSYSSVFPCALCG